MALIDSHLLGSGPTRPSVVPDDEEQLPGVLRSGSHRATRLELSPGKRLIVGGTVIPLPALSPARVWGATTHMLDFESACWVTFMQVPSDGILWAARQQDMPAIMLAHDIAEVAYHTDRHDCRIPPPFGENCLPGIRQRYYPYAGFVWNAESVAIGFVFREGETVGPSLDVPVQIIPFTPGYVGGVHRMLVQDDGYITLVDPAVLPVPYGIDIGIMHVSQRLDGSGFREATNTGSAGPQIAITWNVGTCAATALPTKVHYAAHFNDTSLLESIHVSGCVVRGLAGAFITVAPTYMLIPGGVAGLYNVCLDAGGAVSLHSNTPDGSLSLALLNVMNRPTNNFDRRDLTLHTLPTVDSDPAVMFSNGATILPIGGVALAASEYHTDDARLHTSHMTDYYNPAPPTDGFGGHVTTLGGLRCAVAHMQIPGFANRATWADPLCSLDLAVGSGSTEGSGVPPGASVKGPNGDFRINSSTDIPYWQARTDVPDVAGGVQYGTVAATTSSAPLQYCAIVPIYGVDDLHNSFDTGIQVWVTRSGVQLIHDYTVH